MTSAARDLMDTGTPGPWEQGQQQDGEILADGTGYIGDYEPSREVYTLDDDGYCTMGFEAAKEADARKIVLSVNALRLVANYDDAVMAYLRHQAACQHGLGCVTLSTLWASFVAARDALEAALRGEGDG